MKSALAKATERQLTGLLKNPQGSYLFLGPDGVGKFAVACELAASIGNSADLLILEPIGESIGIAEVQEACYQLALKSLDDSLRILIVRDAHKLTIEAQNAFLKTLEEPSARAVIILTAPDKASLLPTITSRCKSVSFQPLSVTQLRSWLSEQAADSVIDQAAGLPGVAMRLLEDPEYAEKHNSALKFAASLLDEESTLYERLATINDLSDKMSPVEVVLSVASATSQSLRARGQSLARQRYLVQLLQICSDLVTYLAGNGNARLALNQLALGASA